MAGERGQESQVGVTSNADQPDLSASRVSSNRADRTFREVLIGHPGTANAESSETYKRLWRVAYCTARATLGNLGDFPGASQVAEEIAQESLTKTLDKSYDDNGSPAGLIKKIARRLAIDYSRKNKRMRLLISEDAVPDSRRSPSPHDLACREETLARFHSCLSKNLTAKERHLLSRKWFGSKASDQELADEFGLSVNAFRVKCYRLMLKLHKLLSPDFKGD